MTSTIPVTRPAPVQETAEEFVRKHDQSGVEHEPRDIAPDLVVELRSPTDRHGDILIKVGQYTNAGAKTVAFIARGTTLIYTAHELIPQRFSNGDELNLGNVLPGFAVPVKKFFE